MGLEIILARMRVGSNGPPLHRFNGEKALAYWKEHGHRFTQAESSGRETIFDGDALAERGRRKIYIYISATMKGRVDMQTMFESYNPD